MTSGSGVVMIISSWYFDLVRIILSDEVLVDELIAGGELIDDLVEPPDRVMLRDLFLTGCRTEMLRSNEA
jgi:hypothetical protein